MEVEKLLERLWQGDPEARDRLRRMGPEAASAVPALADAAAQGHKVLRLDAIFVLEGMGPEARAAIPALLRTMREDDADLAALAADTLAAIGGEAVDALRGALADGDWRTRLAACQALGAIGSAAADAVPTLIERVRNDKEDVRLRAIWALGEIRDPAALAPLAEIFTREGGLAGCWIAEAFGRYGRAARPVAGALRSELHREDPYLALASAAALHRIGTHEDAAVWALIAHLQHPEDDEVRIEAALTLADFGPKAAAAIPALLAAQREGNEELRMQATVAVAKIRPEYGVTRETTEKVTPGG